MSSPLSAANKPIAIILEPGKYFYCTCGRSKKQPWCDGAHKGHGMAPMKIEIDTKKKYFFCQCKKTNKSPFCDGSHSK